VIKRTIEQRRRVLAHGNALEAKRQVEHRIVLLRAKYIDAMHANDLVTRRMLDLVREQLQPTFQRAAEAERTARAALENSR
jgi:hypothetical protein